MTKTHEPKIKYFLYARKSSEAEDKQADSIEDQVKEMRKLAGEMNLDVLDVVSEAKSAKAPGRDGFNSMLHRISKGEANGILCWKLDRLARNAVDGGQISWMLQQNVIQHIQTFQRGYLPTDNVLMMAVELGMANQFVRDLSVNVKRGLRAKLEKGEPLGVAPEGYLNTPDRQKGSRIAIPDPDRFLLVRRMWDLMLTGYYNPQQVLRIANEEWNYRTVKRSRIGGGPLSRSAIYKLFRNSFYCGKLYHGPSDQVYQGTHKPMVTEEEFEKVQILMGSKRPRVSPKTKFFAHTGQIHCGGCGNQVTAEDKQQVICSECKCKFAVPFNKQCPECETRIENMKGAKFLHYTYYHCTWHKQKDKEKCKQKSIKINDLEKDIKDFLLSFSIHQDYVDWALDYLQKNPGDKVKTKEAIVSQNHKSLEAVNKRLDGLIEMRMAKEIEEEQFKAKKQALEADKKRYEELIAKSENNSVNATAETIKLLSFAERAYREYENGNPNKKREVVYDLSSNLTLINQKLDITREKSLELLIESTKQLPAITRSFEPEKEIVNKEKSTSFEDVRFSWLGSWDSNPGPIG